MTVLTVTAVTLAMVAAPGSAEAAPGDGISGTVTSASGPVRGIEVTACTASGNCGVPVITGTAGAYTVIGLAPGDYYVTFRGKTDAYRNVSGAWVNTTAYLTQRFPNTVATTAAGPGTPVRVTLGQVTHNIDDVAVRGSTFSGRIVTASGAPLVDISVLPAGADGYRAGVDQYTDSNGRYTTYGLPLTAGTPIGTYHLVFSDFRSRYYVTQWYDNLPDTLGQHSTAHPLVARTGDQTLKDVVMQLGGTISGVATSNGTTPLANVYVTLFPTGSWSDGVGGLFGARTDGAGRFISQAVAPGNYRVGFIDYSTNHYDYYNHAQTLATATTVTVTVLRNTVLGGPAGPSLPGAPTGVSARAGNGAATVTFRAPASNGGSAITRYTLIPSPACSGCTGLTTTTTSSTVRGLTNGTAYTFRVTATTAVGTSAVSAPSSSVTPRGSVTPPASPPPAAPAAPVTRLSDFNRDGRTDLVARDGAGRLWLYPGNGAGGFLSARQLGSGWNGMTALVTPGDVTGDGNADVLTKDALGRLWLYAGNGASAITRGRQIGSGWGSFTITNAANLNGSGRPDLLGRDSAGRLWLYPLTGNAVFGPRTLIGTGWNGYTLQGPGDFSGDRRPDILGRASNGSLMLFRGNGAGRVAAGTQAGSGWQTMTALVTPGNWNRASGNDVLARDTAGRLWLYPGNNASSFLARRQIGSGWQGMTYIG